MPKKTFAQAIATQNDIVVGLKDNQAVLLVDCKDQASKKDPVEVDLQQDKSARGRIETRKAEKYEVADFYDTDWNKLIAVLIVITRTVNYYSKSEKKRVTTTETAYYVSNSNKYSAAEFNKTIRQHWHIENKDHYIRDVTLNEDSSCIKYGAMTMAIIRSIVLNIIRVNENKKRNITDILYENSLKITKVLNYIM